MADKNGHITLDTKFGGGLRLLPPNKSYGAVRDPEQGFRKRSIEEIEEQRVLDKEDAEVWNELD